MILVLLQNAWSGFYRRIGRPGETRSHKQRIWARDDWIEATWALASGRALMKLLADVPEKEIWLDDTTLDIAEEPGGILPIDQAHVNSLLSVPPTLVIACGKQAEKAVIAWTGPLLVMPHPAYRLLNSECILAAKDVIANNFPSRCRVWPDARQSYKITELPVS